MAISRFPSGSEWRKWDLHAHTPLDPGWISAPNLSTEIQKRKFAREYINRAKATDLSVIAITDHNFCRTADDLLIPFIQEEATSAEITILPGFEVCLADCGGTHIIAIFSEGTNFLTIDGIVDQLFPPGSFRFKDSTVMPSDKNLHDFRKILEESRESYLLVFAHADRENGVLHRGHAGETRAKLWHHQAIRVAELSRSPSECTGFYKTVIDGTNARYARSMTYIVGSDCRGIQSGAVPEGRHVLGDRFTWIKADPTFEGLRQIVFEPIARVRIQEHRPDERPEYLTIQSVRFIDPDERFQPAPIPVNPDLTVIIGGKSTGKSILLSSIARAIDDKEVEERMKISGTAVRFIPRLDCEVRWRNGDINRISEEENKRRVTYLPQMYIHALVEDENRPKLSEIVLGFLRQNPDFEKSYNGLAVEAEARIPQLSAEVATLFAILSSWREISSRIRELGDPGAITAEIERLRKKQIEVQEASGFTEEETAKFRELTQKEKQLTQKISRLERLREACEEIVTQATSKIRSTGRELPELINQIQIANGLEDADVQPLRGPLDRLIEKIGGNIKAFEKEIASVKASTLATKIQQESELVNTRKDLEPLNQKIKNQQLANEIQQQIQVLEGKLEQIRLLEGEKASLEKQYWEGFESIKRLAQEHLVLKQNIVNLIKEPRFSQVGDGVEITASVEFDQEKFMSEFLECFDLRIPINRLGDFFEGNNLKWTAESHSTLLEGILKKLISDKELRLKTGWSVENVAPLLFHDYLFHRFSVSQNGEDIVSMSPGKQGLILLELLLHLNNAEYPILIDQPEDNLDNRTIYTKLVKFLREKKKRRQIVLVTHNPNLVVGADAEEVIVANQDGESRGENRDYQFEYVSGALECSFQDSSENSVLHSIGIREHVCEVLEGGAEAFRQREEKYCLG